MSIEYIDKTHARLCISVGSKEKRKRYTKRITYRNKQDAKRQYDKFKESITENYNPKLTLEKLINLYINEKEALGASPTTILNYRCALKRIILRFNEQNCNKLTLLHLQDFVNAEAKILSPKTIRNDVSLISSSFDMAVRKGLLKDNPCRYLVIPTKKKPDIEILTKDEIKQFTKDIQSASCELRLVCEFALLCGMRFSEIMALTPEDVDLENNTISINKSLHRVEKKNIVRQTKTQTSNRIVPLPDVIKSDLNMSLHRLIDKNPNSIKTEWRKFKKEKGYSITIHGLRHTHASILHDNGITLAEISKQLGHSNITTTLSVYTHVFDTSNQQILDTINKMSPKCHQ